MPQDPEYLAAHSIMQQQETRIAELEAQVLELQGDVSLLTIENEQFKTQLSASVPADDTAVIDGKPMKKPRAKG